MENLELQMEPELEPPLLIAQHLSIVLYKMQPYFTLKSLHACLQCPIPTIWHQSVFTGAVLPFCGIPNAMQ